MISSSVSIVWLDAIDHRLRRECLNKRLMERSVWNLAVLPAAASVTTIKDMSDLADSLFWCSDYVGDLFEWWQVWSHEARCSVCGEIAECRNRTDVSDRQFAEARYATRTIGRSDDVCLPCWSIVHRDRATAITDKKGDNRRKKEKAQRRAAKIAEAYALLGVSPDATWDVVRRAKHDRVIALYRAKPGFWNVSERVEQLEAAYRLIQSVRGERP